MPTPPPTFSDAERDALTTFGNAWARLLHIEEAVDSGQGPSFVHADAQQNMQVAAQALRDTFRAS